jgi:hypothetical protein
MSTDLNNPVIPCTIMYCFCWNGRLDDCSTCILLSSLLISYIHNTISLKRILYLVFLFPNRLQEYSVETAIAIVIDGNANLKINTQHLRDLSFRVGSLYQFIGELLIQPDNEVGYWLHWFKA